MRISFSRINQGVNEDLASARKLVSRAEVCGTKVWDKLVCCVGSGAFRVTAREINE